MTGNRRVGSIRASQPLVSGIFDERPEEFVSTGVRIYGPGATVAQDLEPEALAVSFDSGTAWIGLQRNNAIAFLDVLQAKVVGI